MKKSFLFKLFGLTLLTICLLTFFCKKNSNNSLNNKNYLIVGTNSGFVPYEFLNENSELDGFDIDLAKQIAKELGKTLIIKDLSFDALILALKQNKVDLIIAGISITKNKQEKINMIHYHGKPITKLPLVFWKKIPETIKDISDFKNSTFNTISVQAGTIQDDIISKYNYIKVKHLNNISDLITDIKYCKSSACLLECDVAQKLQKEFPDLKILNFDIEKTEQILGHGIGVSKENQKLTNDIQTVIAKLKTDKTIEKLENKWFGANS